jgi:hypothetical protein
MCRYQNIMAYHFQYQIRLLGLKLTDLFHLSTMLGICLPESHLISRYTSLPSRRDGRLPVGFRIKNTHEFFVVSILTACQTFVLAVLLRILKTVPDNDKQCSYYLEIRIITENRRKLEAT